VTRVRFWIASGGAIRFLGTMCAERAVCGFFAVARLAAIACARLSAMSLANIARTDR
jgi:hypothetical protein